MYLIALIIAIVLVVAGIVLIVLGLIIGPGGYSILR